MFTPTPRTGKFLQKQGAGEGVDDDDEGADDSENGGDGGDGGDDGEDEDGGNGDGVMLTLTVLMAVVSVKVTATVPSRRTAPSDVVRGGAGETGVPGPEASVYGAPLSSHFKWVSNVACALCLEKLSPAVPLPSSALRTNAGPL